MTAKPYNPLEHSVVQALLTGACQYGQYECPEFVEALLRDIRRETERVYGNVEQEQWESEYTDPEIPGMAWRGYVYSYDDADAETLSRAALPNFQFEDVEIRWYKYLGRGMSVNVEKPEAEWVAWFNRCLSAVRQQDTCMTCLAGRGHLLGCPLARLGADWYSKMSNGERRRWFDHEHSAQLNHYREVRDAEKAARKKAKGRSGGKSD